ncbi:MAG: peptidoglycan-associated lipoprotein Pal [Alphaproteobacteria bacterium]|nr:peptidoglycan-associated lipoprotein Pal [Alphaproteobacteria bacterium]
MNLKFLHALPALFLLVACETAPTTDGTGAGAGGANAGLDGYDTAGLSPEQDALIREAGDRVFFALDSSELTSEGRATLTKQADFLKGRSELKFTIEGHCDERGTREYNLALGERRANAVKKFLVGAGISSSRLNTISYGKERPAVTGSNEEAWAQNRRGVSVVTK